MEQGRPEPVRPPMRAGRAHRPDLWVSTVWLKRSTERWPCCWDGAEPSCFSWPHPLVAAGVADHSSFSAAPGTRLHRLRKTLEAMIALSFGTPEEVERAAAGVNLIHDRVHGQLHDTTSRFSQGTPYSAHDPDLLAWVHITLVDSFLITYELYVGPRSAEQKDQYCAQASSIGPCWVFPRGYLPTRWTELNHCLSDRLASGEITVTDTALIVAREVISPPAPWPLKPLLWILHLPTRGLLPSSIRQGYDLHWSGWQRWLLRVSSGLMRLLAAVSAGHHSPLAGRFQVLVLFVEKNGTPGLPRQLAPLIGEKTGDRPRGFIEF